MSTLGLAAGRSRRGNAGDKLAELMAAGLQPDELFPDETEDVEFHEAGDAVDIVDSDFDETDDEANEEDEGERELERQQAEARRAQRVKARATGSRSALPKALSHVRLPKQVTGDLPSSIINANAHPLALGRDREREHDVRDRRTAEPSDGVRTSSRTSTVASKALLQDRIQAAEKRKQKVQAQAARRTHTEHVPLTQDKLIAEALEVEEQNTESLRLLLEREEALRRRARVAQKHEIQGPYLRWRSVAVTEPPKVRILAPSPPQPTSEPQAPPPGLPSVSADSDTALAGDTSNAAGTESVPATTGPAPEPEASGSPIRETDHSARFDDPVAPPPAEPSVSAVPERPFDVPEEPERVHVKAEFPQAPSQAVPPPQNQVSEALVDPVFQARAEAARLREGGGASNRTAPLGPEAGRENEPRQREAKSFVSLHSLPMAWEDDWVMEWNQVFGDHADWASPTVVPVRNRPHRPIQSICPVSGLGALYCDACTHVPIANLDAARTLRAVTAGEYVWTGTQSGAESMLDYGAFMASRHDHGAAGVFSAFWAEAELIAEARAQPDPAPPIQAGPSLESDASEDEDKAMQDVAHASVSEDDSASPSSTADRTTTARGPASGRGRGRKRSSTSRRSTQVPDPASPTDAPHPKRRKSSTGTGPGQATTALSKRRKSSGPIVTTQPTPAQAQAQAEPATSSTSDPAAAAPQGQDATNAAAVPSASVQPGAISNETGGVAKARPGRPRKHAKRYEYGLAPVVAPGDERSLLATAFALPSRSTRSGRARADPPPPAARRNTGRTKKRPAQEEQDSSTPRPSSLVTTPAVPTDAADPTGPALPEAPKDLTDTAGAQPPPGPAPGPAGLPDTVSAVPVESVPDPAVGGEQ